MWENKTLIHILNFDMVFFIIREIRDVNVKDKDVIFVLFLRGETEIVLIFRY